MKAKKEFVGQLEDRLSQPEMDDFCSSVESGDDARARKILRPHFRDKKVIEGLIDFTRRRIKNDRATHPQLVAMSDVFSELMDACPEGASAEDLRDFLSQPGAPKSVGRHDRTGILWRRDELVPWLERKAASKT